MRVFWTLIAVLMIGAVGMMMMPERSASNTDTASRQAQADRGQSMRELPRNPQPSGAQAESPADAPAPVVENPAMPDVIVPMPASDEETDVVDVVESSPPAELLIDDAIRTDPAEEPVASMPTTDVVDAPSDDAAVEEAPVEARDAEEPTILDDEAVDAVMNPGGEVETAAGSSEAAERESAGSVEATTEAESAVPPPTIGDMIDREAMDAAKAAKDADNAPAVARNDKGELVVDGRWTITGEGTKAKPYRVSWSMLTAVKQNYDPRQGLNTLPAWLTEFGGKWVAVEGYVLLPMGVDGAKELLLMLNQWDGCCIGVPPTPYDAIEVRLAEPFGGGGQYVSFGTITGRLEVDPYLVSDWLLGLYIMNDATVSNSREVELPPAPLDSGAEHAR